MAVKKYTKGAEKQLSESFNQKEFDCNCSCKNPTLIDTELVKWLQAIRDLAGKPVIITSAYRCPTYNTSPSVGGVKNSKHCLGMAADIHIKGLTPNEIAQLAEKVGCRGILRYTGPTNFVHIDTRPSKYKGYTTNKGRTFTAVSSFFTTVKLGSKGDAVKTLQTKLKKLGYKGKDGKELVCDGDFGANTEFALKAFQKKKSLVADGIAGPKTWAKL